MEKKDRNKSTEDVKKRKIIDLLDDESNYESFIDIVYRSDKRVRDFIEKRESVSKLSESISK